MKNEDQVACAKVWTRFIGDWSWFSEFIWSSTLSKINLLHESWIRIENYFHAVINPAHPHFACPPSFQIDKEWRSFHVSLLWWRYGDGAVF